MNIKILDTDIIFHDKKNKDHLWIIRKEHIKSYDMQLIHFMSIYKQSCNIYNREFDVINKKGINTYWLTFDNSITIYTFDYLKMLLKFQELGIPNEVVNKYLEICNTNET